MANKITIQEEIARIKQSRQFMVISILLFAVVLVWVTVSLFTSQQKTTITAAQKEMAKPLQPNLDISVIDSLKAEKFYSDSDLAFFTIYKVVKNPNSGQHVVVPIDTPEETLDRTFEQQAEQSRPVNLLEAITSGDESQQSGAQEEETPLGTVESNPNQTTPGAGEPTVD